MVPDSRVSVRSNNKLIGSSSKLSRFGDTAINFGPLVLAFRGVGSSVTKHAQQITVEIDVPARTQATRAFESRPAVESIKHLGCLVHFEGVEFCFVKVKQDRPERRCDLVGVRTGRTQTEVLIFPPAQLLAVTTNPHSCKE